ncbi:AAA family ATPase [Thermopirellula anaerolimosa]
MNLFIGEPNTGKSNILEALGLLSWCGTGGDISAFVRFEMTHNLFYDGLTEEPIRIEFEKQPAGSVMLRPDKDKFICYFDDQPIANLSVAGGSRQQGLNRLSAVRKYCFRLLPKYTSPEPGALMPPDGANLFAVLYGSKSLRDWVAELFRTYGLTVVLKPHEQKIELQKLHDGLAISYPFSTASDTLQRIVFYHVAMVSNRDAVLVFEEPEAHAFPYYTKFMGEQIADDASNQYFIATHNPYLLTAVLEKANRDEVAVFAVQYKDYETKATALSDEQISRLLDADPFLGLDGVLEAD